MRARTRRWMKAKKCETGQESSVTFINLPESGDEAVTACIQAIYSKVTHVSRLIFLIHPSENGVALAAWFEKLGIKATPRPDHYFQYELPVKQIALLTRILDLVYLNDPMSHSMKEALLDQLRINSLKRSVIAFNFLETAGTDLLDKARKASRAQNSGFQYLALLTAEKLYKNGLITEAVALYAKMPEEFTRHHRIAEELLVRGISTLLKRHKNRESRLSIAVINNYRDILFSLYNRFHTRVTTSLLANEKSASLSPEILTQMELLTLIRNNVPSLKREPQPFLFQPAPIKPLPLIDQLISNQRRAGIC